MQKLFVLKESHKPDDGAGNFEEVNQFMKDTGFVVSVTANFDSSKNINAGETVNIEIKGFEDEFEKAEHGTKTDMSNIDFTVTFSDGSEIVFNSGAGGC